MRASRWLVPQAIALALLALAPPARAVGRLLRVPQDFGAIQEAVDAARPGDLILVDRGTYPGGITVLEGKEDITIRGIDRNDVILDGEGKRPNGIVVEADGVTLENMSAHDFPANAFYWAGVEGFAGRYLTVWNVGLYGIYAFESRFGVFERSLVSGAADAAFYVGECNPCDTTLTDLVARLSAVGFSGTNAGGNLVVKDSLWEGNGVGILPNSFDTGNAPPPQRDAAFTGNVVRDSGTVPTPVDTPLGGFAGIGIGVQGGSENLIEGNEVTNSARYGIAVFPAVDREATWVPEGNAISGNLAGDSGVADLALAEGSGEGNCFEGNEFERALPVELPEAGCADGGASDGDASVAADLAIAPPSALARMPELDDAPHYSSMPEPEPQPAMPGATDGLPGSTSAPPASGGLPAPLIAALAGAAAGAAGALSLRWWRGRRARTGGA